MAKKVGVFSGTFDPVHRGHVEASIVALGALGLDTVLLLLEKKPQRKKDVADHFDRANMLELAITDYPSLRIVDLNADNVTTEATLKYLNEQFPGTEYWYIVGSDMLSHIEDWPSHEQLFEKMNLAVVLRENLDESNVTKQISKLQQNYPNTKFAVLPAVWSPVSSSKVKQSLYDDDVITGLDPAVHEYIKRHKLYI